MKNVNIRKNWVKSIQELYLLILNSEFLYKFRVDFFKKTKHLVSRVCVSYTFTDVTLPRLKAFIPQLLSRLHIEALLHGNITKQVGG